MSEQVVTARLHVTGIGPYLRREYRRLRDGGFEPRDATLVIFGMVRAAEVMNLTMCGDVDLRVAKR